MSPAIYLPARKARLQPARGQRDGILSPRRAKSWTGKPVPRKSRREPNRQTIRKNCATAALRAPVSLPVSATRHQARGGPRGPAAGGAARISGRFYSPIRRPPDGLRRQLPRVSGGPRAGRQIVHAGMTRRPGAAESRGTGTENAPCLPRRSGGSVLITGGIRALRKFPAGKAEGIAAQAQP